MKKAALKLLGDAFTSKKFLAMLAGVLAWVIGKVGMDIPSSQLLEALGPLMALISVYILGQGQADKGKEAAKVAAAATKELAGKKPETA